MTRSRAITTLALAGAALAAPGNGDAAAQRPTPAELAVLFGPPAPAIGVRAGWEFGLGATVLGAQGRVPFGAGQRGVLLPSGELVFGPDRIDWQLNADAAIAFGALRLLYVGAGAAFLDRVFDDDEDAAARTAAGLNLFAGVQFPRVRPPTRAFLELRTTAVEGGWPTRLVVGINWRRLR